MSLVEHFVQKVSPKAIKFFSVPLLSLLIGGTVTIVVLGPIGAWVSNLINILFTWLNNMAPWIVPTVVGVFSPMLVMTGTHYGLIPIGTNNLATVKWDTVVGPGMLVSNVAQGAAGLAVGVRSKNSDTKQQASSAGLTGLLGITEPVLYGVNLKFMFPLYAAMIGGGVGGLYLGITKVARFAGGSPGLLVLPAYIPTEEVNTLYPDRYTMSNLVNACIGVAIAIVVAFVASFIMYGIWAKKGKLDPEETGEVAAPEENAVPGENGKIFAPIVGEVIALEDVEDEVFSSGAMGNGIAIIPAKGEVHAPCDGTISSFFPTGHAVGIASEDGADVLIHVGMDTVKLGGKGFEPQVKEGDTVKKGQLLLKFDIDYIKSQNLPVVTPVIITNSDDFGTVTPAAAGAVDYNTAVITYEK
jgi:PTS system beta-glucosides-specific IIC component